MKTLKPREVQQENKWVDNLINLFTVPTVKLHINDDKGILSKDKSIDRIVNITLIVTFVLAGIASTLVQFAFHFGFGHPTKIILPNDGTTSRVPHVFIIYQDGLHMDFSTDERISPTIDFPLKLRTSKTKYPPGGFFFDPNYESTGYLAYADLDNIYIFYTDGKKDVTYIDIRKGFHQTITNTNFGSSLLFASGVKVGNDFFMISDRLVWGKVPSDVMTYKWTGKKSRIFKHMMYSPSTYTYACYASYNRSHFLRVGTPSNESTVQIIELERMKDTILTYVPLFVGNLDPELITNNAPHRKTCSITFNKHGNKNLIVIAKHPERWGVVLHQLNLNSMQWTRAATNMKHYGSLVIAKGIMYHFNILNGDQHFGYYYDSKENTWKDLDKKQMKYNGTLDEDRLDPIVTVPYSAFIDRNN